MTDSVVVRVKNPAVTKGPLVEVGRGELIICEPAIDGKTNDAVTRLLAAR